MSDTSAKHCLPMLMANQAGWEILNPNPVRVTWTGGASKDALEVAYLESAPPVLRLADSQFGHGILTFKIPFLFRTEAGYNLLARGPANRPKDGISPLEGLVETDWAVSAFTMNWKFTRPGVTVEFHDGEPLCMVVPQARHEIESFRPSVLPLHASPETEAGYRDWMEGRLELVKRKFLAEYSGAYHSDARRWEQDYYRGRQPNGTQAPDHQTRLRLANFAPGVGDKPDAGENQARSK